MITNLQLAEPTEMHDEWVCAMAWKPPHDDAYGRVLSRSLTQHASALVKARDAANKAEQEHKGADRALRDARAEYDAVKSMVHEYVESL